MSRWTDCFIWTAAELYNDYDYRCCVWYCVCLSVCYVFVFVMDIWNRLVTEIVTFTSVSGRGYADGDKSCPRAALYLIYSRQPTVVNWSFHMTPSHSGRILFITAKSEKVYHNTGAWQLTSPTLKQSNSYDFCNPPALKASLNASFGWPCRNFGKQFNSKKTGIEWLPDIERISIICLARIGANVIFERCLL